MDKLKECLDRIRLIRGVNNGILTDVQFDHLVLLFGLDDTQKQALTEKLNELGIAVTPESELPPELLKVPIVTERTIRPPRKPKMGDKIEALLERLVLGHPDWSRQIMGVLPLFKRVAAGLSAQRQDDMFEVISDGFLPMIRALSPKSEERIDNAYWRFQKVLHVYFSNVDLRKLCLDCRNPCMTLQYSAALVVVVFLSALSFGYPCLSCDSDSAA